MKSCFRPRSTGSSTITRPPSTSKANCWKSEDTCHQTMTMSYIHKHSLYLLLFTFLGSLASMQAQERFTGYWEPQVSINYGVTGVYSHNFSLTNRIYLIDVGEVRPKLRQFELGHFSKLKIRDDQSLALGIQYRLRNNFDGGANQLRITQQYSLNHSPFVLRFGHRLRAEQQ